MELALEFSKFEKLLAKLLTDFRLLKPSNAIENASQKGITMVVSDFNC